ncbi:MAG: methionine--tRNA ligase [Alphaproteobacteria bacterium]|nr:methionine--tRNA ligase [Alphaproteobacteria bacterium]
MKRETFYITSPIYYVNDVPHIGHAYTTLACDMLARFYRQAGRDVAFLTGTDEHGQKVQRVAEAKGIDPKLFVDDVSKTFRILFEKLGISNTVFARTTSPDHYKAVQDMWKRLKDNNQIYLGSYSGWYAVRDEAFYGEDEIKDGKAPTGAPVEYVTEPSYFFRLSAWQQPLLDYYEAHPDFIAPESRRNEVISFVKGGLRDLSISRTSITWGVPVPGDEAHVIYVWLDALNIYLSGLGYPSDKEAFEKFWSESLHIVGKDILRFHAVYWPAFLMAAGMQPPKRIFAHGWWTKDGEKISKSIGKPIDPVEIMDQYGNDAFRYFVLREVPFGNDGDYSEMAFINRLNADLANTYGNLVQRTLAFVYKQNEGKLPTPGAMTAEDKTLLALPSTMLTDMTKHMEAQSLHRAIERVWEGLFEGNRYMDVQKPWSLKATDPERMQTILYVLCDFIRQMAILSSSIVPELSSKILDQLGIAIHKRDFDALGKSLTPGADILEPKPLVQKVV